MPDVQNTLKIIQLGGLILDKDADVKTKKCQKCLKRKPIDKFPRSNITYDGLFERCYACCHTNNPNYGKAKRVHYEQYIQGVFI